MQKITSKEDINVIRTDYLVDKRIILATARAKRPEQYTSKKDVYPPKKDCPFCPENKDKVSVIQEKKKKKGWQFRSVHNPFGILMPHGHPPHTIERKALLNEANAYGYAEVVIDTPNHRTQLADLSVVEITDWLTFLKERVHALQHKSGVKHISIFKNKGRAAGASLAHSHTQIITTPFIPRDMKELRNAHSTYVAKHGHTPFIDIMDAERTSPRFVYEDEYVFVLAPFASETPLELWLIPKKHHSSMIRLNTSELAALASALKKSLQQLNSLGHPSYNLLFINDTEYGSTHFHLRLHPRFTIDAGFEYITGLHVNTTKPEDAAAFYKKGFS